MSARAAAPIPLPKRSSRSFSRKIRPMLMSNKGRPATLHYMAGTFRVLSPGDHVVCAVTGEIIPLEELKYWSVERQEPYVSPEAVLKRLGCEPRPQAG